MRWDGPASYRRGCLQSGIAAVAERPFSVRNREVAGQSGPWCRDCGLQCGRPDRHRPERDGADASGRDRSHQMDYAMSVRWMPQSTSLEDRTNARAGRCVSSASVEPARAKATAELTPRRLKTSHVGAPPNTTAGGPTALHMATANRRLPTDKPSAFAKSSTTTKMVAA